jgi:hypothetical protein
MDPIYNQDDIQTIIAGDDLPLGTFLLHSRFDRVVNFYNSKEEIASVTSDQNLLASNAIFVSRETLKQASSLELTATAIRINGTLYDRNQMKTYNSKIDYKLLDGIVFEEKLQQVPLLYANLFPDLSLFFIIDKTREHHFTQGFTKQFMQNIKKACARVSSGEVVQGLAMIKGTGFGLTPSGDDFIAGFLLGTYYLEFRSKIDLSGLRENVFTSSMSRNLLVNTFLSNAYSGNCFNPLKKVLLLLGEGVDEEIAKAIGTLVAVGSTSGADLFTGYLYTVLNNVGL